jgi:hypothetical protein
VMFHWRNSVSVFTGAEGPRVASHLLKSRFALESRGFEKFCVIAAGWRRAGAGGRVIGIGRRALKRAEHDGVIGHGPGHGAGGVLVGGNRNHAVRLMRPTVGLMAASMF